MWRLLQEPARRQGEDPLDRCPPRPPPQALCPGIQGAPGLLRKPQEEELPHERGRV